MKENKFEVYNKSMSHEELEQINAILELPDLFSQYNYIYNKACEELDERFAKNNYCDFQNNICACQRNEAKILRRLLNTFYKVNYTKEHGFRVDAGLCYKLDGKRESQKCIACKLFTCQYLKKNKIKIKPDDIFLIKIFFNRRQKRYIERAFFKSQEEIVERLVKMNTKL